MFTLTRRVVLADLTTIAKHFSGQQQINEEKYIYKDLDINGQDFIDFIEEVERRFGVDLETICPRARGKSGIDVTLTALTASILEQRTGRPD
jgi:hypothetical protein